MIDRSYEELAQHRRLEAARALGALEVEEVPDPQDLCSELEGAYGADEGIR